MEINGRPRLGCMTRMSNFEEDETITITPLPTFPVIRDLVTDVSFNYQKARELPAFAPPAGVAPGEYRMQQVDVERSQEFRKCIECFLCQNVCHVVRDHEDNKPAFSGPRFFIRAAELDMHPLDARTDRKEQAVREQGIGYCNITKCCTEVCPEHIKITDNGIIPLKERVADAYYDPLQWAWRKLRGREATGAGTELPVLPAPVGAPPPPAAATTPTDATATESAPAQTAEPAAAGTGPPRPPRRARTTKSARQTAGRKDAARAPRGRRDGGAG